jgi:hypothetical protein
METSSKRALNRARWQDRVNEWQASELSQKAYCEQHHLGLASFRRWCGIFRAEQSSMPEGNDATGVTFLPVSLQSSKTPSLTIRLNEDVRIDVAPGFDPVTLRQVIQALGST